MLCSREVSSGHVFAAISLHCFSCWEPGQSSEGLGTGQAVLSGEKIMTLSHQLISSPNQNKLYWQMSPGFPTGAEPLPGGIC